MRERTASDHALIEGSMPVMSADFDLPKYHQLLRKLYGFYLPFETQIRESKFLGGVPFQLSEREKLAWLEADLLHLDPTTDFHAIARATDLPVFKSLPEVLGALYVTEGSTLGGLI